jgi:DNA replication protein DnaC
MAAAASPCPACQGRGWRLVETAERSYARRCDCWLAAEPERRLRRAGVPSGLWHCELASFEPEHHPQLDFARRKAEEFVDTYPLSGGAGLLFHGPAGTGKTHLVVAIVRELVLRKSASARLLDFRVLLKTIQESWNPVSETSEKEVLRQVAEVDLLALDDLGAEKPSPWVRETVAYVINERYTRAKPVLITTNLKLGAPTKESEQPRRDMARRQGFPDLNVDYLEDRVGVSTLSRLLEMCLPVPLTAVADYRRTIKAHGAGRGWRLGEG